MDKKEYKTDWEELLEIFVDSDAIIYKDKESDKDNKKKSKLTQK